MYEHMNATGQITRCESCSNTGTTLTCNSPTISYGTTIGGIPSKHQDNDYDEWCRELGFVGPASVGTSSEFIHGALKWCSGYDDPDYKWCDEWDGFWKDSTLDHNRNGERITRLTCTQGKPNIQGL